MKPARSGAQTFGVRLVMKLTMTAVIGASLALAATPAFGQTHAGADGFFYGDLGGGVQLEDNFDTFGIVGRFGYEHRAPRTVEELIDALAYEAELFYGVFGQEEDVPGGEVDNKVRFVGSGSVRAIKRFTPRIEGFARLGVARASLRSDFSGPFFANDNTDGETDVLLGVGGEYKLTQKSGVRADFTTQNDLEGLMLSYTRDF